MESGQSVDMITERINKRQQEKKVLEEQLALEISKQFILSEPDVTDFLYKLKNGSLNNIHRRRSLINIFVGAIYLFDDKFRIILNGSEKPIEIDDVLIDEVNDYFDGLNQAKSECSHLVADAPPVANYQPKNRLVKASRFFLSWKMKFTLSAGPNGASPTIISFDILIN